MKTLPIVNILFYLRLSKVNSQGKCPIYCRITVDGQRAEFSTGRFVKESRWDSKAIKVKGSGIEFREINEYMRKLEAKIRDVENRLIQNDEELIASVIRDKTIGKGKSKKMFLEVLNEYIKIIEDGVGTTHAKGTLKRYKTVRVHSTNYIKKTYHKEDISLSSLDHQFILRFDQYLVVNKNISRNTATRYLKLVKTVVNYAVSNEWIERNPLNSYKLKTEKTKVVFLDKDELNELENKKIVIKRLDRIRDVFVFCCYTGLSYSDVKKLTEENIAIGINGSKWIITDRTKTKVESKIPLLPQAESLLQKYEEDEYCRAQGKLLPVISNAKTNAYLKELADICGINKELTFHKARHTFATTVTLANDVSIESVSRMLGHKSLRTTQIYAQVVDRKVLNDMEELSKKLAVNKSEDYINMDESRL